VYWGGASHPVPNFLKPKANQKHKFFYQLFVAKVQKNKLKKTNSVKKISEVLGDTYRLCSKIFKIFLEQIFNKKLLTFFWVNFV